jgi:hypothetical protein
MGTDGYPRHLNEAMEERRLELGIKWVDVTRRAGISTRTLERFRNGTGVRTPDTTRAIERALEWRTGSIASILDGQSPVSLAAEDSRQKTPDEQPSGDDRMEELQTEFDRLEEQVRQMRRLLNQQRRREA